MPFTKQSRSLLAEQFAEIYQSTQDDYRSLLSALRDENVDVKDFISRVESFSDRLVKLKRIHEQLVSERAELSRDGGETVASPSHAKAAESPGQVAVAPSHGP